jgi:ABC-type polysaccharide/polyol phosphate transport system ATPase subunit
LVSHSAPLLREVCNRIVWIEDGRTKAQGDVEEVLEEYLKISQK